MVVQDALTGYVHEAPEFGYAEAPEAYGQVAYDGFGNPVGFLLPRLIRGIFGRRRQQAAVPMPVEPPPAPMLPPELPPPDLQAQQGIGEVAYDGLGNPVGFLLPGITPPRISISPPRLTWSPILGRFVRSIFSPTQNRWIPAPAAAAGAAPYPYRRPWPLGWIRQPLPYTGLGPNRLYMRCAVWPGPKGLVPAIAAQMMPGAAVGPGGPRRRRSRRRR